MRRVVPAFVAEHGREPADRHEVRAAMPGAESVRLVGDAALVPLKQS